MTGVGQSVAAIGRPLSWIALIIHVVGLAMDGIPRGLSAPGVPVLTLPGHGTYTRESINLVGMVKNMCGAA